LNGSTALPLSLRAQPRDLQFYGPFLEMFFDRAKRLGFYGLGMRPVRP
jgi:hypothetical protein